MVSTSINLLQNAAKMIHGDKTHLNPLCIKQNFTYFCFHCVSANRFRNWFSPFLHYLLVVSINIVNIWEPSRQNLLQLLVYKNPYLKRIMVTCIFKNWLFCRLGTSNYIQNGTYTKIPMWYRPYGLKGNIREIKKKLHISTNSFVDAQLTWGHSLYFVSTINSNIY